MNEHIPVENSQQALTLMEEGHLIVVIGSDGKAAAVFFMADGEVFNTTLEKKAMRQDYRDHVTIGMVGRAEEFNQLHFRTQPIATKDDELLDRLTSIVREKRREKKDRKFCFNCGNHKLIDGSFDGGVIQCTVTGEYIDLMAIAPDDCADYIDKKKAEE